MSALRFHHRPSEQGGIAILLALTLITLMGAMVLSLSRDTLRDVAIVGNEAIGRKAAEAADAGVDWAVMWAQGTGGPGERQVVLDAVNDLSYAIADHSLWIPGTDATLNTQGTGNYSPAGYLRVYIDPNPGSTDMIMDNSNYAQTSNVRQQFNLEVRYLAPYPLADTSALSQSKSTGGGSTGAERHYFLIRSVGRANIYTDPNDTSSPVLWSFLGRREALVDIVF